MEYFSLIEELFHEIDKNEVDLISYFEEIVGFKKNEEDFFSNLLEKYIK